MQRQNGHKRLRRLTAFVGASALLALTLGLISVPAHRAASADADSTAGARAVLTVQSRTAGRAVPRSFFGLSTEYWTLPIYERRLALFERVLSQLRVRGDGPMILRIGGDSADHARWDGRSWSAPHWVFRVTPAWLAATRVLVAQMRLQVILDMNLVTGSPLGAASLARAALAKLPHGSLTGLEIGNEPDIYDRTFWIGALAWGRRAGPLPAHLTAGQYQSDFEAYAARLKRVAPGVPLIGPALANPKLDAGWISRLLDVSRPGPRAISIHHYALSACAPPRASNYPTIPRVLSERATTGVAQSIARAIRLAHHAGLPLRMTELNSVTCGGLRGVSNTFATALWAPDALFGLLRAGVNGVNLHVREFAINAPFTFTSGGLFARPLLYGMIMFARTLGPDGHLLRMRLDARSALHLKAWAVRTRGNIVHILLIDKGSRAIKVALRLPARGEASVQRLLAPSVKATGGVSLAGQHLTASGHWRGRRSIERVAPGPRGYELTMPAGSAALVSLSGGRR